MSSALATDARWQLYGLLADPVRLRLLALAGEAELSVGELAELLSQTQPNVSRHAQPLRRAGLLSDRKDGTRTFLKLTPGAGDDAVVADAVGEGRRLCEAEGSLVAVADVVRARDSRTREYFASAHHLDAEPEGGDLAAYLFALGALLPRRGVAVDAGTGDGTLLEAIAPFFERVVAVDRSEARLDRARRRTEARGYRHVDFVHGEVDGVTVKDALDRRGVPGADIVVAGRMLHHAPIPGRMIASLASFLVPGGRLLVVDYAPHGNESFREAEADVWTGFEPSDLLGFAEEAGLTEARVLQIPLDFWPSPKKAPASRVPWLALVAMKPLDT